MQKNGVIRCKINLLKINLLEYKMQDKFVVKIKPEVFNISLTDLHIQPQFSYTTHIFFIRCIFSAFIMKYYLRIYYALI